MKPRIILCCLLFLLARINPVHCQGDGNGLSDKYTSKRAMRLASRLTKDKATDREKLDAIFDWITKNIKYDVKKFLKHDTRLMSTNKILRKKKGLCTAYSQVFGELCYHAGLKTVEVEGYTKNIFTDSDNKYYYSDHVWNAIELDDKWEHVDMTWCAGYIKFTKKTLWLRFLKMITMGKIDKEKFKPHFVRSINKKYFLPDPNILSINHLALDPAWQLMEKPISIDEFERDSSNYYSLYKNHYPAYKKPLEKNIPDPIVKFELDKFYTMKEKEQIAQNGDKGNNFNIKNSVCKANGEYSKALLTFKTQKKKLNLSEATTGSLEEAIAHCETAIAHTVCHTSELKEQKTHLDANNKLKKQIVDDECKKMLALTGPINNGFRVQSVKFKQASHNSSNYRKKLNNTYKRIADPDPYKRTEFAKSAKAVKIQTEKDACFDPFNKLQDSINMLKKQIEAGIAEYDLNNKIKRARAKEYMEYSNKNNKLLQEIMFFRLNYMDALDYEIQYPRGKYLFSKVLNDSSVYIDKQLFPQSIIAELKTLRSGYEQIQKLEAQQERELIKVKKNSSPNSVVDTVYKRWEREIKAYHTFQTTLVKQQADTLQAFSGHFKKCAKVASREISKLKGEKKLEQKMFRFRKKMITNENRSRKNYNKSISKLSFQLIKVSKKQIKTIEKEKEAEFKKQKK